ncbi:hypothetical protein NLG97_g9982 [Lecanicillium saksenae]|uniref:Uncharacterized protein n=1 Tax=Lecanicillium saksenae TaxID=468837 RepID=A0ACC1QEF7_9HYPO|nr:hypothetical protein NLG97_g9982 [Lecanicillium saksenae]
MDPDESSSSPAAIPTPHPMIIDPPPAPSERDVTYYNGRLPLVQPLFGIRDDAGDEIQFGAYQQSAMVLLPDATLAALASSSRMLASVCSSVEALSRLIVRGWLPQEVEAPPPATTGATPAATVPSTSPSVPLSGAHDPTGNIGALTTNQDGEAEPDAGHNSFLDRTWRSVQGTLRQFSTGRKRPRADSGVPDATSSGVVLAATTNAPTPAPGATATAHGQATRRRRRSQATRRSERVANFAKQRDGECGKFTNFMGGIEAAHILPHSINATVEGVQFFQGLLTCITIMFGPAFAQRISTLLGSRVSSDKVWNVITLDVYIHRLYDTGLIGFRPIRVVEATRGDDSGFEVQFSLHWFGRTRIQALVDFMPTTQTLRHMATLRDNFRKDEMKYRVFNAITGNRVAEGAVESVFFLNLMEAQNMFDCLTMSWVMRTIYFGAGASGETKNPRDDPYLDRGPAYLTEDDYIAETQRRWDQYYEDNEDYEGSEDLEEYHSSAAGREIPEAQPGRPRRRRESSDESAGGQSVSSSVRRRNIPVLSDTIVPFTSSMINRLRRRQGGSDESQPSTAGSSSASSFWSRRRGPPPSSRTSTTSHGSEKAVSGGGQIQLQVQADPVNFASNPSNVILEAGETDLVAKQVSMLASPQLVVRDDGLRVVAKEAAESVVAGKDDADNE